MFFVENESNGGNWFKSTITKCDKSRIKARAQ